MLVLDVIFLYPVSLRKSGNACRTRLIVSKLQMDVRTNEKILKFGLMNRKGLPVMDRFMPAW